MNSIHLELYSGIKQHLKTKVLRRGNIFAACGIALWLLGGALIPLHLLSFWGIPIFLLGSALIALGMVPYRRLTQLESQPHRLIIDAELVHIWHKGKPLMTLPLTAIHKMEYRDSPCLYGIALWIDSPQSITPLRHRIDPAIYVRETQRRHSCDLFLPYFGKHAYVELLGTTE